MKKWNEELVKQEFMKLESPKELNKFIKLLKKHDAENKTELYDFLRQWIQINLILGL